MFLMTCVATCDCDITVKVFRKRDRTIRVTISGPGDLTDAKVWFSVKRELGDVDVEALITKMSANVTDGGDEQAKVIDGPNGILEIYIIQGDTADISEGDYWFDVVVETSSGRRLEAVRPSRFRVVQPVTMT